MDKHYTPQDLAERALAACGDGFTPETAADFAAGEGALLAAVQRRWRNCRLLANDVDRRALQRLQQIVGNTQAAACDFLNIRSRAASRILRASKVHGIDLIILNPPFSNRGSARKSVALDGLPIQCGTALAFVVEALAYLSERGRLLAILPTSCLTSDRDANAISAIRSTFRFREVLPRTRESFKACSVEVACVLFERHHGVLSPVHQAPHRPVPSLGIKAGLYRGTVPVSATEDQKAEATCFVHTTNMRRGKVEAPASRHLTANYLVRGPAILIPRVGRPNLDKLCVLDGTQPPLLLSDCVFALQVETSAAAQVLFRALSVNWNTLSQLYSGSCAPYVTRTKLVSFIRSLGVEVDVLHPLKETKITSDTLAA